ncbi:hypothetical protein K6X08_32665, partial [Burkholderia contaminans]|uniref:hypothetical protein n=1 Tax=Burkholderia contaminans TaxID=488447 RepID=UPI001C94B2B2
MNLELFGDVAAPPSVALSPIVDPCPLVDVWPGNETEELADRPLGVAGRRKGAGDGRRNGASRTGGKTRIRTVSRLRFFAVFGNCIL